MATTRELLGCGMQSSQVGILPHELQDRIESCVPVLNHVDEDDGNWNTNRKLPTKVPSFPTPLGDPTIPPATGTPFLTKLPPEIRRTIFLEYLLPDKSKNIVPTKYARSQDFAETHRLYLERSRRRMRNDAQRAHQAVLQRPGHWASLLGTPLPPLLTGNAPNLGPAVPNVSLNPAFGVAPPLTANPLNGWTVSPQNAQSIPPTHSATLHNSPSPPVPNPAAPVFNPHATTLSTTHPQTLNLAALPSNPTPAGPFTATAGIAYQGSPFNASIAVSINSQLPQHHAPAFHNFVAMPTGQIIHQAAHTPPISVPQVRRQNHQNLDLTASSGETKKDVQSAIIASKKMDSHDATPTNAILTLLTTNVKLCLEVSTILFEEYTFEVHIHPNGVDLLHFDRIPTLETCGQEIENAMAVFESKGHFCFNRMKHVEFVFFAGRPDDRLAGLRMRESLRRLIHLLKKDKDENEKNRVTSIKVRFDYEQAREWEKFSLANSITDRTGNFWLAVAKKADAASSLTELSTMYEPRESIMHKVYNVQLVSAPLKALRHVHNVEIEFPPEISHNPELIAYALEVKALAQSRDFTKEAQEELMREEMIMDARRDKELANAGAGGYYKPVQPEFGDQFVTDDSTEASPLMMKEDEIEEPGLVQPFGPSGNTLLPANHGEVCDVVIDEIEVGEPALGHAFDSDAKDGKGCQDPARILARRRHQ
ncbi:uncharacterized protein PV09_00846 [Verruconis gallopava]|uniref:Uncharacterized protein n=1 Tax=Verruconis gallopava TaxID=253628 RepID=A0A0D2AQZ6_9PEZI|nr:uncharacterized protein PV09_00846 [Verruconis gallopava]KIW08930.1 hypothetical protein PV09_00846 [Verruconis gallopava]